MRRAVGVQRQLIIMGRLRKERIAKEKARAEVQGNLIIEPQYGNSFDVFSGQPEGDWCPFPPLIGSTIGSITGGPTAIATFDIRESFFGGVIEVLVDTNAKKA